MTNEIIIKAIQKINPTAQVSVSGDDINTIVWENGTTPIPLADIQAQIPTVEAEIEQEKQDAINNKTSAQNKLKALGLTDAEIKAL
tara:strand:+ start:398 stop:655 length:258 start_codon:yes stop_codon:yes gene_type:complete